MQRTLVLAPVMLAIAFAASDVPTAEPVSSPVAPIDSVQSPFAITIPQLVSYQGRLTDTLGVPVPDGDYSTRFALYTQASGGNPYWQETQSVSTEDGLFAILLGSVTPIPYAPEPGNLYLGMKVGSDPEMTPRVRIVSAAYSYLARRSDTANYALAARPAGSAGGDLAGTYPDPTVAGLRGRTVASTAPAQNQVLKWQGSVWTPADDSVGGGGGGGTVTSVSQGTGVSCTPNPITTTGTVGLNTGYTDGRYVNVTGDSMSGMLRVGGQLRVHDKAALGYSCYNNGFAAFCAGYGNSAGGDRASISGGEDNSAGGQFSHIGGGSENRTSGRWSTAGGGNLNEATDTAATIAGGMESFASSPYATVGGGQGNAASGRLAAIGGGFSNLASDTGAVVGGGYDNTAGGHYATVGGGRINVADSSHATVTGGYNNYAGHRYSFVGGGYQNKADGRSSVVCGGWQNRADTAIASVVGGYLNQALEYAASVGGGYNNIAYGNYATVAGGRRNEAEGEYATVAGGYQNSATSIHATVGGGYVNSATSGSATVAGGYENAASRSYSTVGGGADNEADGIAATVCGGDGNAATNSYASVGGGFGATSSGQYSVVSGGRSNTASGYASTATGGYSNHAAGSYSIAAGNATYLSPSADYSFAFGEDCSTTTSRAVVFYHSGGYTKLGVGVKDPAYQIECSGGARCNGVYWVNGSDPRSMSGVVPLAEDELQEVLGELDRADVVRYRLASEPSGEEHIGLVARDAPEAVATPARDGINTADAIGWLVAIAKAQQAEIELLKAAVERKR